ncbi:MULTISPECIES: inositol monophosphatase family protein [Tessaracoccus]|uniref:Inositol monophosphatase family protein n=2 Tax=Tessaracoccus TaxID=72763 RepID=A0ABY8PUI5_9ACTN|nr:MULTISPECIES: inositol monophosphatase family protein [Tessaracoccus]QXT64042.1 histidinol phosphatase [Tessaracoccus palaemonis]WGT46102.1 inositol monophosphatase family protein [Tessaracoccus sp. T21]
MAQSKDLTDDVRLAHLMADDADSLSMSRFKALDLRVKSKPDNTPVTEADTAVEEAVRRTLARTRPRDAVHGEEYSDTGDSVRRWIVDPIDGTKNYVRGVPVWATLIALEVEGRVVASVVSAPALGRRWWASEGGGAYTGRSILNATEIRVSQVSEVADASLSYSEIPEWVTSGRGQGFINLMHDAWRSRAYGDFWSYMLVAEGSVDIASEPDLELHDMAALDIIVREAGGRFTNLDGVDGVGGPGALATNGLLHDRVLEYLARA